MIFHFAITANVDHTFLWSYDAQTKAVMLEIGQRLGSDGKRRKVDIGAFWLFEPTIGYYRSLLHYDWLWLNAATRDPLVVADHDLVYCFEDNLENAATPYGVWRRFPETHTLLIEVQHVP